MFFSINVRPSAVDGSDLILINWDLMKSSKAKIVKHAKPCFLKHSATWLSLKKVALLCRLSHPSVQAENVSKITAISVSTKRLLWRSRPFFAFFDIKNQCSQCLSLGQAKDWKSFKKQSDGKRVSCWKCNKMSNEQES